MKPDLEPHRGSRRGRGREARSPHRHRRLRRAPPPQRTRRVARPIAAVAVAVVLIAGVLSPPGRASSTRSGVRSGSTTPNRRSSRCRRRGRSSSPPAAARGSRTPTARAVCSAPTTTPRGRRLAATSPPPGPNELVTLDPEGTVRWTLARPAVRFPRWTGSATNTRIAYLSGDRLHVVAGDGNGDFVAGAHLQPPFPRVELEPRVHPRLRRHATGASTRS